MRSREEVKRIDLETAFPTTQEDTEPPAGSDSRNLISNPTWNLSSPWGTKTL